MVVGVIVPMFGSRPRVLQVIAFVVAGLMVIVGLALLDVAATKSASDQQRPRVDARVITGAGGMVLKGAVTASGLKNDQHVVLLVYGRSADDVLANNTAITTTRLGHFASWETTPGPAGDGDYIQLLLGARAGPDPDGKVELPFEIPVAPGLYDHVEVQATRTGGTGTPSRTRCDDNSAEIACRTIWLPPPPPRPRLNTSVTTGGVVSATVKMSGLAPDDKVKVTVRSLRKHVGRGFAVHTLAPDAQGTVEETLKTLLPAKQGRVCVRAKAIEVFGARADKATTHSDCVGDEHTVVAVLTRPTS
jgi:hypothetical protein